MRLNLLIPILCISLGALSGCSQEQQNRRHGHDTWGRVFLQHSLDLVISQLFIRAAVGALQNGNPATLSNLTRANRLSVPRSRTGSARASSIHLPNKAKADAIVPGNPCVGHPEKRSIFPGVGITAPGPSRDAIRGGSVSPAASIAGRPGIIRMPIVLAPFVDVSIEIVHPPGIRQ